MWAKRYVRVCILSRSSKLKAKVTYLWGTFWRSRALIKMTIFSIPWSQVLALCAELCILSVTYLGCGSALPDTTDNLSEKYPTKLTDIQELKMPVLYNIQSYRGHIFPQWISQVVTIRDQIPFENAANPICFVPRYLRSSLFTSKLCYFSICDTRPHLLHVLIVSDI